MSDLAGSAPDRAGLRPAWTPDPDRVADAAITRFARQASQRFGCGYRDYADLWAWSVKHLDQFWATVWDFFDLAADLHASARAGLTPGRDLNLGALRVIGSTGAPLPADPSYWVRDAVGPSVQLASTSGGSLVISGRSDSTLNRNGVRLGGAEIYSVLDTVPQVADAVRAQASPRHLPDDIIAVAALPHTRTGKRLEVPVKRLIQGHPLAQVASPDAVDDYSALAQFAAYAGGPGKRQDRPGAR